MKRRVIQIADSTQLISLPRKWAQLHGIKKGDELEISEQGNKLLVSKDGSGNDGNSSIEVDVTGIDKDSLIFIFRGLYIKGYNEIKFTFKSGLIPHFRVGKDVKVISVIHGEVNRSTGFEIIQERENFIIVRNIATMSSKEFDSVLKRVFLLISDASKDLYTGLKNNDKVLIETLEEKHDTITKLLVYNLRTLNSMGYSEYSNTSLLFHIVSSLDNVIDILRNTARDIINGIIKPSKSCFPMVGKIVEATLLYSDLYYDFNFKKAKQFSEARDLSRNQIRRMAKSKSLTNDDVILVVSMQHCLELFRDLYSARIAMVH